MPEPLGVYRYICYARSRWRFLFVSCLTAAAIAFGVSAALPREFTAIARILIEPPAGSDVRAAVAVSPIYLESLKTYEQFAASDSLFRTAVDRFGLRGMLGNRPVESLKGRVLKVGLLRNTRILEVSATLPDPRKALELARFVANSTIEMNQTLMSDGDQDLTRGMERQRDEVLRRRDATEAAWTELLSREPVTALQNESESAAELRSNLEQQLVSLDLEIADTSERAPHATAGEATEIVKELGSARARRERIRSELEALKREEADREKVLSLRLAHRDRLEAERKLEQAQLSSVETQLREVRGGAAYRGERLKVIDPGIVPERPSAPNVPLNTAAAFLLGLILPAVWLALEMSYRHQSALRSFARAIDD